MLLTWVVGIAPVLAVETASEQAVRAAMVFNFIKFTDWPDSALGLRSVCVATSDPQLMAAMEALGERQVRSKPVAVVRYQQQADCDVLYVDSRQRWRGGAEQRPPPRALTIGGYAGFVADGGMIEVALQDGNVRFDLNVSEAKKAGLRFYPQLLRLARRIVE